MHQGRQLDLAEAGKVSGEKVALATAEFAG
jgi:hypothetical protein